MGADARRRAEHCSPLEDALADRQLSQAGLAQRISKPSLRTVYDPDRRLARYPPRPRSHRRFFYDRARWAGELFAYSCPIMGKLEIR